MVAVIQNVETIHKVLLGYTTLSK